MKYFISIVVVVLCICTSHYSQWIYEGAWPDTNYKGGMHGIAVSPDGKVWTSSYHRINWNGNMVSPIIVFNADGSLFDTIYTVTVNGITDTLGAGANSGCRGLAVDQDGNVLYVSGNPDRMFKINHLTGEGMEKHIFTEIGNSPAKPGVSDDGVIFVGPVVAGGNPDSKIVMFDTYFNFLGVAVETPPGFCRGLEISPDGLTLYWPYFVESQRMYIYTRPTEFNNFELSDSVLQGMFIESIGWNPANGNLWVSHDLRGPGAYTHLTWYEFDITSKTLVDSFFLPIHDPTIPDEYPRGIAFSPDGNSAYVGLYGATFDRIYKFSKIIPVELTTFTASVIGSEVILNWSTASELNNHGFEIQRKTDDYNWSTIGFKEGEGTTTEIQVYSFADRVFENFGRKIYYRLKQVDFDGKYVFTDVVEVELNPVDFALLQNYPNPFNPSTKISWQSPVDSWQVLKVFDVLGNEVRTLVNEFKPAGIYEVAFNANALASGVYYYQLRAGDYVETKKMLLAK